MFGDHPFRPVASIDEGNETSLTLTLLRARPAGQAKGWGGSVSATAGAMGDATWIQPVMRAEYYIGTPGRTRELTVRGLGAVSIGDAPAQQTLLLGGRGSLPGYGYHEFAGDRLVFADADFTQNIIGNWIGLHLAAAAGATAGDIAPSFAALGARSTDGVRSSAGIGVSLLWNSFRIDRVFGLNDGDARWQISFSRMLDDIS